MPTHAFIRFLGEKVAAIERNRRYPIRNQVFRLAPLPSADHERQLVILCEPRNFSDASWSAWSWHRHLYEHLHLHVFVDGAPPPLQVPAFRRLFPGATLDSAPEYLARHFRPSPGFARFLHRHPFARKLALLVTLQTQGDFLYSDADLLAFRRPDEILYALMDPRCPGLFMEEPCESCEVDPWVAQIAERLGLPRNNHLNSGLLFVRRGSFDLGVLERILADWRPEFSHRAAEQTIISVLMALNSAHALPDDQYVVSEEGRYFWQRDGIDYREIVARHFVGHVRHLLYKTGLQQLQAVAKNVETPLLLDRVALSAH